MTKKSKRPLLQLNSEEQKILKSTANSRTLEARVIERAKILLYYYEGLGIEAIAAQVGVSRPTVYKCIDKALGMGYEAGLKDLPHSPKKPVITLEAKAWVTNLACTKPKDLGLA